MPAPTIKIFKRISCHPNIPLLIFKYVFSVFFCAFFLSVDIIVTTDLVRALIITWYYNFHVFPQQPSNMIILGAGTGPAVKTPGVPGFESQLHSPIQLRANADPGRQEVMAQVAGFPEPTWDTWTELSPLALAQSSASHCRHLGSKSFDGSSLSDRFCLLTSQINKKQNILKIILNATSPSCAICSLTQPFPFC